MNDHTPNFRDPDAVAAAGFICILLKGASHHDLDNDWRQKLTCHARQKVREELDRIFPYLRKRYWKWREAADWHRITMMCPIYSPRHLATDSGCTSWRSK